MSVISQMDQKTRKASIEKQNNISLKNIGDVFCDDLANVHCENLIGAISIPLGVAGPLLINQSSSKFEKTTVQLEKFIPIATTEGALVASINRGCKVINEAGGVSTYVEKVGVTRGVIFRTKGINESEMLKKWLTENSDEISKVAQSSSSHLKLKEIDAQSMGRSLYVRFSFDTDQAMGMNMATIAADKIASFLSTKKNIEVLAVAGNYDTDKKPSWLNMIKGRGRKISAEIMISNQIIRKNLHTTPVRIVEVVKHKCWGGSILSGSLGFNAQYANIVAGVFLATGQDAAHIVEGSLGVTCADVLDDGSLYFSVYLPDILLGVVGGGTKLKTQTEARTLAKVSTSDDLAELLAGAVLAGELSLIASIAENSLASAHKKLGR